VAPAQESFSEGSTPRPDRAVNPQGLQEKIQCLFIRQPNSTGDDTCNPMRILWLWKYKSDSDAIFAQPNHLRLDRDGTL
jgi:hypothetical protein